MRQRDDHAFASALNNMSEANMTDAVTGLWNKFTDATVGTIARSKVRGNDLPNWTPIYKTARVFQCGYSGHSSIDRKQFLVVPA